MKLKAEQDIRIGNIIELNHQLDGRDTISSCVDFMLAIGVAARNIKKGEVVNYDPLKNTEDILISSSNVVMIEMEYR
jgi:hypothetical protein